MDGPVLQSRVISLDGPVLQLHVTAQFYLESKEKHILKAWGWANSKDSKWREAPSSFYMLFSPPPRPALCGLGSPGELFVLPEVLTPVLGTSFVLFYGLFPSLSFSHCHSGLLFPILTTLHPRLKRWEAHLFGNRGIEISLATSCWTGMARSIGPPLLAGFKPQSPYSSVHLRVCDIFHGWL